MPTDRAVAAEPTQRPGQDANRISRRWVIGGATAVMGLGAGGAGWIDKAVHGGAGGFAPDTIDLDLSSVFLTNAQGFYTSALAAQARCPQLAAHFLAIAIELSLKSYLLHQGFSDDWNRVHLGHDLSKALRFAERAGLRGVPAGLPAITALLAPYYQRHAFNELNAVDIAALGRSKAYDSGQLLLDRVREARLREAALGPSPIAAWERS